MNYYASYITYMLSMMFISLSLMLSLVYTNMFYLKYKQFNEKNMMLITY